MAGRVRVVVKTLPPQVMRIYPERCPAWDGQGLQPCCLSFPGEGEVIRQCPLFYGSEAWIAKGFTRHRDVEALGLDLDLYPHERHGLRILCLAAPVKETLPGALVQTRKEEDR